MPTRALRPREGLGSAEASSGERSDGDAHRAALAIRWGATPGLSGLAGLWAFRLVAGSCRLHSLAGDKALGIAQGEGVEGSGCNLCEEMSCPALFVSPQLDSRQPPKEGASTLESAGSPLAHLSSVSGVVRSVVRTGWLVRRGVWQLVVVSSHDEPLVCDLDIRPARTAVTLT